MYLLVKRAMALMLIGLTLSACSLPEALSRVARKEAAPEAPLGATIEVVGLSVRVPRTLQVSELNSYHPMADIVWRGDAPGNRYDQVKSIMLDSLRRGVKDVSGVVPVVVDVEVTRFHSLTNKTRYLLGGIHSIAFEITLLDPATGAILVPTRKIKADLEAYGGAAAIEADRAGQTQKVRITDHLAEVFRKELSGPVDLSVIKRVPSAPEGSIVIVAAPVAVD